MFIALISIIIFVCVLLVLVILAQNPKGGGLSSQCGGGSTSNLMGVKRTGDLLEKLTWGLAIALMVFSLSSHIMLSSDDMEAERRSINEERARQDNTVVTPAPALPQQQNGNAVESADIPDAGEIPEMVDTAQ
ncbi:MAG: preprotein translocase subunit SecG [Hymenobacteraceae bacterium]|nr:preprotein translocase subunit SecG [Hymenobacteraceae bacterium]MDX5397184.1 preprotein translocase subunit SecG [Hymenobacteraceae bacterium]MDX5513260.1 preprotein translocase subunit SecG [Hymenobacteraceae bacterium]